MRDDVKQCVEWLREDSCGGCVFQRLDGCQSINDCMNRKAADLIESLAVELEQVKRERDALQAELDALNEEYFTDIHTARDPMANKVKQLEREWDAAVEDVKELCDRHAYSRCDYCKVHDDCYVSNDCMDCVNGCNWQWRGVKED